MSNSLKRKVLVWLLNLSNLNAPFHYTLQKHFVSIMFYIDMLIYISHSEHGSNHYEVSSQTQMRSQVPWLSVVLKMLQDTLQLMQDLIDKVLYICMSELPVP